MSKVPLGRLLLAASLIATLPCAGAAPKKSSQSAPKATPKPASKPVVKPVTAADIVGFWRLERDAKNEIRSTAFGPARRLDAEEFFFTEEVPGQFIYDPIQKFSYPNTFSLNFQSEEGHNDALEIACDAAKAGLNGHSMTLEMFFKPNEEWDSPIAMKARADENGTELGLEARFFKEFGQTYLHAFITAPGGQTEHFRGGHYGSSVQVHAENLDWRHMAVVCDVEAKTLSCYVDYFLAKTIPLPEGFKWDDAPFYIGGGPLKSGFKGRIDEVRITRAALRPAQMLRARNDPIANVSFASSETILPRDTGYVDFKEAFGAIGDGRTDDTLAFQQAFRALSDRVPPMHYTLYIPPGTYIVNGTIHSGRFLTVQGAGPDKTVILLHDKSELFASASEAHPVWRASSNDGPPGSNKTVNNTSNQISIHDLTIDTGKGNPGAKGLEYHSNGGGRLENVRIRSGDGTGLTGLDLTQKSTGPALIKNVQITGFDFGVVTAYQEYSMTIEGLALTGQRLAGIKNNGNILAIRKLSSVNAAPAILSEGANSMVTLLDSTLKWEIPAPPKGRRKTTTPTPTAGAAIQADGALYAARVETPGYKEAIRKRVLLDAQTRSWKSVVEAGPKITEFIGDQKITGHGALTGALQLPIENTPEVPWGDIAKDWVSVQRFAAQKDGDDWAPAIQAAIDSGARTIYFPFGRYDVSGPVHVRGKVERLFGLHSRIAHPKNAPTDAPVLIFDEPEAARIVSIERLTCDHLHHASPATLVLKSSTPERYTNAEGCGKLFMEDAGGADYRFTHPQRVWVRQWNPESQAEGPLISSHGATIWCLGFKSESGSGKLWAEAGAQTEILGGFIFPLGEIPADRPIFKNTGSRMSLVYGTSVYDSDFRLHIVDLQGESAKQIGNEQLKWSGSRARMDLFTSDATTTATGN